MPANTVMRRIIHLLLLSCCLCPSGQALAHHSFAVHFVADTIISVTGVVTDFRFTNPHGLVYFTVRNGQGGEEAWKAETNSPNILRRRGWSRTAIQAGDTVTIEGFPARDGSHSLRIHRVVFPDGRELLGQRLVLTDPDDGD